MMIALSPCFHNHMIQEDPHNPSPNTKKQNVETEVQNSKEMTIMSFLVIALALVSIIILHGDVVMNLEEGWCCVRDT